MRSDALVLLLVAAGCLLGVLVLADLPAFEWNLIVVGMFGSSIVAIALVSAGRGTRVSGLPMLGFGALSILLGFLSSHWIYGDGALSVLGLQLPLRPARLVVLAGYSLLLAGLLLPAYLALRKATPRDSAGASNAGADASDDGGGSGRARVREMGRRYLFGLKVIFSATVLLLIVIFVTTSLGVF
jgi:hypothetical protein